MKIKEALGLWFKSKLVAQIEFTEWTPDGHLRHSKFVGLREDKGERDVVREVLTITRRLLSHEGVLG